MACLCQSVAPSHVMRPCCQARVQAMLSAECHACASAAAGLNGAAASASAPPISFPSGCAVKGNCNACDQAPALLALPAKITSGVPAATRASKAAPVAGAARSNQAASMISRSAARSCPAAVLRVMALPSVTCQSRAARLATSCSSSARTSNEGASKRPRTLSGTVSCTTNGTGPWSITLPALSSRRACRTSLSATGGNHCTVKSPLPAASARTLPFSASSCRRAGDSVLRWTASVNMRPSASSRGKVRRSVGVPGTAQCSGRAGRSSHWLARRPSPAMVSTACGAGTGTCTSAASPASAAVATSTSAASNHWRRHRYASTLAAPMHTISAIMAALPFATPA
jgi:hypothetical protein